MDALKQLHLENCTMVDLVQQEKWWRISSNELVKRKSMTAFHKANTLAWLVRNARKLIMSDVDSAYATGAPDEVISEAEVQARWRARDPEVWMLNQPLVRALLSDLCELAYPAPVDPEKSALFLPIAAEISEFERGLKAAVEAVEALSTETFGDYEYNGLGHAVERIEKLRDEDAPSPADDFEDGESGGYDSALAAAANLAREAAKAAPYLIGRALTDLAVKFEIMRVKDKNWEPSPGSHGSNGGFHV